MPFIEPHHNNHGNYAQEGVSTTEPWHTPENMKVSIPLYRCIHLRPRGCLYHCTTQPRTRGYFYHYATAHTHKKIRTRRHSPIETRHKNNSAPYLRTGCPPPEGGLAPRAGRCRTWRGLAPGHLDLPHAPRAARSVQRWQRCDRTGPWPPCSRRGHTTASVWGGENGKT